MKRIIFFALLFSGISGFTQDLELENPMPLVEGLSTDFQVEAFWGVHNAGASSLTLGVYRENIVLIDGAKHQFCWGSTCYGFDTNESPEEGDITIPAGGTEDTFHVYYRPQGNHGMAEVKFCFFERENPTNELCYNTNFEIDFVEDIAEEVLQGTLGALSPNPVGDISSFSFSSQGVGSNLSVQIINMVGKVVKNVSLSSQNGIVFIDSAEFSNGIYFYALKSNNNVLATKKFIVAK